ncbi:hypothetical protein HMPREF1982_04337 [Clostridiales bacterium oral taxon 876 str. F0540]|nr:hypothetical protein HMPREF1982_04337 [Clostridiales bacterium oral taxon 876 str. F0540]
MDKNNVKNLFCQTYDIGADEVKVTDFTDHTMSVEIENQAFHYTYSVVNNVIRFKPVEK